MRDFLASQSSAFTPEDVQLLVDAFDDAWALVKRYDGITDDNRDAMRLALAKRIVESSDIADGDRLKLRDWALASLGLKKTDTEAKANIPDRGT
jgi:hypothetical protein